MDGTGLLTLVAFACFSVVTLVLVIGAVIGPIIISLRHATSLRTKLIIIGLNAAALPMLVPNAWLEGKNVVIVGVIVLVCLTAWIAAWVMALRLKSGLWKSVALTGAVLLLVHAGIRTLIVKVSVVASGSMSPTLLEGDRLLVSKFAYGYSRHSLPFSLASFSGRILAASPVHGDIVVYRRPPTDGAGSMSDEFVGRVVGLPSDRLQMLGGKLYINGQALPAVRIEDFILVDDGKSISVRQFRERLPNGVDHMTLDDQENGFYDNTPVYTVPPGRYFIMGDRRDNSLDSRARIIGDIPFENMIGKVQMIYFSTSRTGPSPRWERMLTAVR